MVFGKKIEVQDSIDLSGTKLKSVLELCKPEEQYILVEKYGLISGHMTPMQQIGNKFSMSRERIRQITNRSLTKVRRLVSHDKNLEYVIERAKEIVKANTYILSETSLINELLKDEKINLSYNESLLLLSSDYDLYYLNRNKRFDKLFFIEPLFEDLINDIHDGILSLLKKNKSSMTEDMVLYKMKSLFSDKFQRNQSLKDLILNDNLYHNIVKLSRDLYALDGKFGLKSHSDVNPKTLKQKMEYILDKYKKPMHYKDLADKISEIFKIEDVKYTTIHNELVKNSQFINVGMGLYGLKKWGYHGDNTIDAIKSILEKAGRPMNVKEVTKEVLKERIIKEVTVLLVLQKNKDIFERVGKGLYQLKK